ncbi:hypothetical protein D3C86_1906660 [compost metagenome]
MWIEKNRKYMIFYFCGKAKDLRAAMQEALAAHEAYTTPNEKCIYTIPSIGYNSSEDYQREESQYAR